MRVPAAITSLTRAERGSRRARGMLGLALALFVAITALRFDVAGLETPVAMLYVFPIAIVARLFNVVGGLVAATSACVAFGVWLALEPGSAAPWGIALRMAVLLGVGVAVGWVSREREREGEMARVLLDVWPEPASVKDLNGRYLLANPALARVLHRPVSEIVGTTQPVGQPGDVQSDVARADQQVVASGEPVEFEVRGEVPGVGRMAMRTVKAPVKDARGKVVAIVTLAHDISARVEHERRTIEAATQARAEYERALRDYQQLMRHRLANPLTVIQGSAHTLDTAWADDPRNRRQVASLILSQTERLAQLDVGTDRIGVEEHELDAKATADLDAIQRRASTFSRRVAPLRRARDDA